MSEKGIVAGDLVPTAKARGLVGAKADGKGAAFGDCFWGLFLGTCFRRGNRGNLLDPSLFSVLQLPCLSSSFLAQTNQKVPV